MVGASGGWHSEPAGWGWKMAEVENGPRMPNRTRPLVGAPDVHSSLAHHTYTWPAIFMANSSYQRRISTFCRRFCGRQTNTHPLWEATFCTCDTTDSFSQMLVDVLCQWNTLTAREKESADKGTLATAKLQDCASCELHVVHIYSKLNG